MPLLQNGADRATLAYWFDYQSECHCSKTFPATGMWPERLITSQNATAPKPRTGARGASSRLITSQNATAPKPPRAPVSASCKFDYQSECHCSKTSRTSREGTLSLITSQNATAPKQGDRIPRGKTGLITSQNATAPKRAPRHLHRQWSLITSQNATAPKPMEQVSPCKENGHPAGKHLSALKKVLVNNHFILECIGIHVGIIFQHEHA